MFMCTSYSVNNPIMEVDQVDQINQVVMIVVNRCDLKQLYTMTQIQHIMDNGYVGLMNTRVSGRNSEAKAYATIGWGTRAEASLETAIFHNVDEEIASIYKRRTGKEVPGVGIVNTNIHKLIELNRRGEFNSSPGALGEQLRLAGLNTAVIGNSDTDDRQDRVAGYLAMDSNGYIDMGDISSRSISEDISRPFGIKTDYEELLLTFDEVNNKASFIVIETGDMNRLEAYKGNLTPFAYQTHKEMILSEINSFIKVLVSKIDFNRTMLMLVVPYPSEEASEYGARLTPVVFYFGGSEGGLLTSDTTRREGVIGNIDIAPTVLNYLNVANARNMTGRNIALIDRDEAYEYISLLNKQIVNTSRQRYRVLYSFAVFEMLISILALLAIIFRKKLNRSLRDIISLLLLGTIIPPLAFLVIPIFGYKTATIIYFLLITITALIVITTYYLLNRNPIKIIVVSSGIILLALTLDILTGQHLIKQSIMGYDPIIGARYYGIGNEYAGILIGSSLVFSTALIEYNKRYIKLIPILYIALVMAIGLPIWGANVGATITATVSFLFASLRLYSKKVKLKSWVLIAAIVTFIVTVMALIDLFLLEKQSHLASAIQQIINGGPMVVIQILTRKVAMNIRVMGVTIWSRVLLIAIVILGILFYKPTGLFKRISNTYPKLAVGWSSILIAGGVGFLVNDSGVVTAAMSAIYLTTTILYLLINDIYIEVKD